MKLRSGVSHESEGQLGPQERDIVRAVLIFLVSEASAFATFLALQEHQPLSPAMEARGLAISFSRYMEVVRGIVQGVLAGEMANPDETGDAEIRAAIMANLVQYKNTSTEDVVPSLYSNLGVTIVNANETDGHEETKDHLGELVDSDTLGDAHVVHGDGHDDDDKDEDEDVAEDVAEDDVDEDDVAEDVDEDYGDEDEEDDVDDLDLDDRDALYVWLTHGEWVFWDFPLDNTVEAFLHQRISSMLSSESCLQSEAHHRYLRARNLYRAKTTSS